MPTLAEVVDVLHGWYPPETAEDWDAVGLAAGDPEADVRRILLAVDPVLPTAEEAAAWDADLLLTHHPLFLKGVHGVAETTAKGRTLAALTRAGCGLLSAHTNADRGTPGVSDALARALGLRDIAPVLAAGPALDKLVVFAPVADADAVRAALHAAGAGHVGDYDTVSYTVAGEGRFRPLSGAHPAVGEVGRLEVTDELRIEALVPRHRRTQVIRAVLAAHSYEEVAYDIIELGDPGTARTGMGRVGEIDETTLGVFADRVVGALPPTARGVLVGGDQGFQPRGRANRASFRRKKMLFILPMPLDSISRWRSTRRWQMSPMLDKAAAEHQPICARARTRQRCIAVKPRE